MSKDYCWLFARAAAATLVLISLIYADTQSDVNALTGNLHSRVVWREGCTGGNPWSGYGHSIKGFDSETGQTTVIYDQPCLKSVIAAGGHRVLVTTADHELLVMDWDGSNSSELVKGMVSDGWRDPTTGAEYAIYRAGGASTSGGIYKVNIDNPSDKTKIYNGQEGHSVYPWFQLSADGEKGASYFPQGGKNGGIVTLPGGARQMNEPGCWASMASDNSYRWLHLGTGPGHQNLTTIKNTQEIASVKVLPPGQSSGQIYDPRAAEGPEHGGVFFTLGGNYPQYNKNSSKVEIWLGKFNEAWNSVEGWARITNNNIQDHHPSAWIGVESEAPSIRLSDQSLEFEAEENGAAPPSQTVTISSEGGALEGLTVSSSASWLTVSLNSANTEITNTVDPSGLDADVHTATVTVSASNAKPASQTYTVNLAVQGVVTATAIEITPDSAVVLFEQSATFAATVKDQYGTAMDPQPAISWSVSPSGPSITGGTFVAGTTEEDYTITASASGLSATATASVVETLPIHLKINCGDNTPAVDGWGHDQVHLVAGHEGATHDFDATHDVSRTKDPAPEAVYRTVRNQDHRYSFDVPDGKYAVRLHFTDLSGDGRLMNYILEGSTMISDFNVAQSAGGTGIALVRALEVNVTDGNGLQISAEKGDGNDVFEAGIEIIALGEEASTVSITSELAGKTFCVGGTIPLSWYTSDNVDASVEASVDGGKSFHVIAEGGVKPTDNAGSFSWTVPATIGGVSTVSEAVELKVSDYWDQNVSDRSGTFTITAVCGSSVKNEGSRALPSEISVTENRISLGFDGPNKMIVYNMLGNVVRELSSNGPLEYVHESRITSGVYFVKAISGDRSWLLRFTVKK